MPGPSANCQTLVTKDGTTSSAAACAGAITTANNPIPMVGKPRPITPFTKPASRKVASVKPAMRAGASMRAL
jgi:hypothetical protein